MTRFWRIWYYLSIVIDIYVLFIFLTNSPCFGEVSQRCGDVSESDILVTVGAAFVNTLLAYRAYKGHFSRLPKLDLTGRGDKTLPLLYFPFFALASFFIGEVLPVVIGIFAGKFDTYGAKEPIIKTLPDFGLVLIIYAVFGVLFWLFYRALNWKIVAAFALILAFILERYVYWQVEGSIGIADTISIGTILTLVMVYLLVLVLPFGIFQVIRRRWGERGTTVAVIVVLLVNVLGLGFTYFHMVKTGWWQKYRSGSTGRQNQSNSVPLLPPNTCPDRLVTEKDKQTVVYWNGKTLQVAAEEQQWVEQNCPASLLK